MPPRVTASSRPYGNGPRPMLTRVRRFLRYSSGERSAAGAALGLLALARVALRLSTVPATRRIVARLAPAVSPPSARLAELTRVAAGQLPGSTACLPRAIVLEALLRASGRPAELKIGIAALPAGGRPDTHAWVEVDGVSLDETARGYTALPLFGTRG